MSIRSAAKAVILHDNRILVNECIDDQGRTYFDLPGGGQNQFETIEEAVIREVLEETGYAVTIERFVALAEEICDSEELRNKYPDYSHRIFHIFLANLLDETMKEPEEMDWQQQDSMWVSLEEVDSLSFRPSQLTGRISKLIYENRPQYLGCSRIY